MTSNTDIVGNKLIAEFMGATIEHNFSISATTRKPLAGAIFKDCYENNGRTSGSYLLGGLQYHSSWDWLMPVVEKIRPHIKNDTMFWKEVDSFEVGIKNALFDVDIKTAWQEIVDFISWYNKGKEDERSVARDDQSGNQKLTNK